MIRRFALLATAAAAATLSFASVASAAPVTQATPAAQACPSGWFTISNAEGAGAIKGDTVNEPVLLSSTGNCFEAINKFTYNGFTGYEYQNGVGHCLWDNIGAIYMGAACKAGHPNEEFYGVNYSSGGWTVENVGDNTGAVLDYYGCVGPDLTMESNNVGTCYRWNF